MILLVVYVALLVGSMLIAGWFQRRRTRHDFASLKTVTFGDESAVYSSRTASVVSIITVFIIWGAFTGSALTPIHVPGPFVGEVSFDYAAVNGAGEQDVHSLTTASKSTP